MLFAPQTQNNEVLSQEFRITSPSDRDVEYIVGLYFYAQDTGFDSDLTVGLGANRVFPFPPALCPAPCTAQQGDFVNTMFEQETESIAGYGNLTWHISDVWDITGGLRWSRDEKEVEIAHTNLPTNSIPINVAIFPPNVIGSQDRSESKVTWSFNTRYSLSEDVMLFFTSSTGFTSTNF